jgi:hypothetical protein
MDEIDRAIAALKRHLEAAIADPEISAVPALAERIRRFEPLLVPERGTDSNDGVMAAVESLVTLERYFREALSDPRISEIDRQKLRDALVVVFGFDVDDDASERTLRDLPWTAKGSARRAADSRWRNNPTRDALDSALDAVAKGSTKSAAARAAAERFGVPYETIRKRLQGK